MTALEKSSEKFAAYGELPLGAPPHREAASEAEIIFIFASNTEVLNVEDFLEEKDLDFALVPVPKEVNPNCGLAISCPAQAESGVAAALDEAGFRPQASYLRRGDDFAPLEKEWRPPIS
ncbi:MAG: DUF3343 domain-containing protein [Candidatus Adiutrix sp.]|jgi:hypothetical protein|nr:DUF3343 domain-containing protein [Candidatus Adiutrix sp.]